MRYQTEGIRTGVCPKVLCLLPQQKPPGKRKYPTPEEQNDVLFPGRPKGGQGYLGINVRASRAFGTFKPKNSS